MDISFEKLINDCPANMIRDKKIREAVVHWRRISWRINKYNEIHGVPPNRNSLLYKQESFWYNRARKLFNEYQGQAKYQTELPL
jgi:hypothetical protein